MATSWTAPEALEAQLIKFIASELVHHCESRSVNDPSAAAAVQRHNNSSIVKQPPLAQVSATTRPSSSSRSMELRPKRTRPSPEAKSPGPDLSLLGKFETKANQKETADVTHRRASLPNPAPHALMPWTKPSHLPIAVTLTPAVDWHDSHASSKVQTLWLEKLQSKVDPAVWPVSRHSQGGKVRSRATMGSMKAEIARMQVEREQFVQRLAQQERELQRQQALVRQLSDVLYISNPALFQALNLQNSGHRDGNAAV